MGRLPEFVRVRPARGWAWLVQAHAMFAHARLTWLLLVLSYWLLTALMSVVPILGVIAATLLKPVFAVGFLAAAWAQERGERPRLAQLFAGFRSQSLAAPYAIELLPSRERNPGSAVSSGVTDATEFVPFSDILRIRQANGRSNIYEFLRSHRETVAGGHRHRFAIVRGGALRGVATPNGDLPEYGFPAHRRDR